MFLFLEQIFDFENILFMNNQISLSYVVVDLFFFVIKGYGREAVFWHWYFSFNSVFEKFLFVLLNLLPITNPVFWS